MSGTTTGLVLAGGAGRRMDGADKGLLALAGRPLVAHVIERLAPQVGSLLISANRNLGQYRAFGYPVVCDGLADFAGPLAGLQAGLAAASTPLLLSVPCDSPAFPAELATRLREALATSDADVAVVRADGRVQRAFSLVRRSLLPALDDFLAGGGRRIGEWHDTLRCIEVVFADAPAFANANTPGELAQLGAYLDAAGMSR